MTPAEQEGRRPVGGWVTQVGRITGDSPPLVSEALGSILEVETSGKKRKDENESFRGRARILACGTG